MKYRVFHNNQFMDYAHGVYLSDSKGLSGHTIIEVAVVDCTDLDDVFHKTNHIDSDWFENKEVIAHLDRARSTSIGDVIFDGKKYHVVQPTGFREVTDEERKNITIIINFLEV